MEKDFDTAIENREEPFEKNIEMGRNNDYTTGSLLDYEDFSKHYKIIAIDLSKKIELKSPDLKHQLNSIGRLDENNGATMFFIIEKIRRNNF